MQTADLARTLRTLRQKDPKVRTLADLERRVSEARATLAAVAWGANTEHLETATADGAEALGAFTWTGKGA